MMCVAASKWTAEFVLTVARAMLWVSRTSAELFPDNVLYQIAFNFVAYGLPLLVLDAFVFPTKKASHNGMYLLADEECQVFAIVTDMKKFIENQLVKAFGDYQHDTAANTALAMWINNDETTIIHIENGQNEALRRKYSVKKPPTNTELDFSFIETTDNEGSTLWELAHLFKFKHPNATLRPEWKDEAIHILKRATT